VRICALPSGRPVPRAASSARKASIHPSTAAFAPQYPLRRPIPHFPGIAPAIIHTDRHVFASIFVHTMNTQELRNENFLGHVRCQICKKGYYYSFTLFTRRRCRGRVGAYVFATTSSTHTCQGRDVDDLCVARPLICNTHQDHGKRMPYFKVSWRRRAREGKSNNLQIA
jgi:hypothetical protein